MSVSLTNSSSLKEPAVRLIFLAIGVAEGLVWWWVDPFGSEIPKIIGVFALFFATSTALVGWFTWNGHALGRWGAVTLAFGMFIVAVTWSVWNELPPEGVAYQGDHQRIRTWVIGAFVLLYVTVPFAQTFQNSGRLRFPYADLFQYSWNNFFVGFVAALFAGAFWAVLAMWGALFNLIGVPFFADLFWTKPFSYISTFAVFGYGIAVGRAHEGVISTLRRITLMASQALLPLVVIAALLFLLALPFTGLEPLWGTGRATPLILGLLAFLVIFLNGVFSDGDASPTYPRVILWLIEGAVIAMPAYAAIALYATGLRVSQYGLTPDRVYALLLVSIALVYSVGYSAAVILQRPPWLATLKSVNVGSALLVALLAVLIQLPLLDPLRLSAENQLSRLREQKVAPDEFDFATLRFGLGHHGWKALEQLEAMDDHPRVQIIRQFIQNVRAAATFRQAVEEQGGIRAPLRFTKFPEELPVPKEFVDAVRQDTRIPFCRHNECLLVGVDLDRDGVLEHCVLWGSHWFENKCYARTEDHTWKPIGRFVYRGAGPWPSLEELKGTLTSAPISTRSPRYDDVVLPDAVLEFVTLGTVPNY